MVYPSIHGQLEWDSSRKEVQYIISWADSVPESMPMPPSERVTAMYGNVEVISEGRANNVAVLTELVPAKKDAAIQHPNGKLSVEIPAAATKAGHDLYFAVSSGYNIDPPKGKMFIAGGVAYNTTALPLTENEADRIELTELVADMTLRFNYSADMAKETLEICYLNSNVAGSNWEPVPKAQVNIDNGVATVTTTRLGAYALMMRKDVSLNDVEETLDEVRAAFNSLKLATTNGADGSNTTAPAA